MKMLNYYRYLKSLRSHCEISSEYPPYVGIETTAVCNLSCNKCPVGRERIVAPSDSFMKMGLYRKIIDEIKDHSIGVCLSYFGEPLINPHFFDYVQYAKNNKLSVSFYSNGTCLDDTVITNILLNNVDSIAFSVDCLPQDYKFYAHMKNVSLDIAKAHLADIIDSILCLRDRIKKAGAKIQISVIRMDAPESTPLDIFEKYFEGSGIAILSGGAVDWGGTVKRITATRLRGEITCHHLWSLNVNSSGIVAMCHVDYNGEHIIGDAKYQSVREIYNGDTIRLLRRRQYSHNIIGLPCVNCSCIDFDIKKTYPLLQTLTALLKPYDQYDILRHSYSAWKKLLVKLR